VNTASLVVWHSLLSAVPLPRRDSLSAVLSSELQQEMSTLHILSLETAGTGPSREEELERIHYSWVSPFLRTLPEREIKLFLSALSQKQIKGLKQSLMLSNSLPTPSPIGASYLKETLYQALIPTDLLPIACLPSHPLNQLLLLSFDELLSLIDLLSMHDLSVEIRHIIDTGKLKEIYSLLSKPQITFLKTLLHSKEAISFKKMGLHNWRKDREALSHILTQRGINRLAKALYSHPSALRWYLAHHLDMERGKTLLQLATPLDHPKASELLGEQVIELIDALKPK
jgi:hypothetical protein